MLVFLLSIRPVWPYLNQVERLHFPVLHFEFAFEQIKTASCSNSTPQADHHRIGPLAILGRGRAGDRREFTSDGIDLIIGARFAQELDEDQVFWRQRSLAREIFHALRIEALVIDLDSPLDDFLKHIEPMLASPYHDEIGSRSSSAFPGV